MGGTLRVRVEREAAKEIVLSADLLQDCTDAGLIFSNGNIGFYPAASGYSGSSIKFVGFQPAKQGA